jgi:hypothetical protein
MNVSIAYNWMQICHEHRHQSQRLMATVIAGKSWYGTQAKR